MNVSANLFKIVSPDLLMPTQLEESVEVLDAN